MLYTLNGKNYIVTAAAYDGYGYANLTKLKNALLVLFIIGLTLLFATGYILARTALRPIKGDCKGSRHHYCVANIKKAARKE